MFDRFASPALVQNASVTSAFQRVSQQRMVRASLPRALAFSSTLLAAPTILSAQGVLGTAQPFAVLAGSAVTNAGASTIGGNLGVSPGVVVTGMSTLGVAGAVHLGDAVALQAQRDAATASAALGSLVVTTDLTGQNLGGLRLTPGVYSFASSAQLTGDLFLDFLGGTGSNFVFQIGSTLTTAAGSSISVLNGSRASSIFFLVGSSATLGASSTFRGNVVANGSITLGSGARIGCGRAIALAGVVTLDGNTIANDCPAGVDTDFGSAGFSGAGAMTTVPEPTSLVLFGIGGAATLLVALRRRGPTSLAPRRVA